MIESIELWLSRFLGDTKLPLLYVVHTEASWPDGLDPRVGETNTKYTTHEDEMVARAPIYINNIDEPVTEQFAQDNRQVWQLMENLTKNLDCWHIVKPYQR